MASRKTSRPAILAAARQLLERGGALTLDEVGKAAGVSRQAVYLHFENRNQLILAVADEVRAAAGVPAMTEALAAARTPRELVAGFVEIGGRLHPDTARAQLAIEALCRGDAALDAAWRERTSGRLKVARAIAARLAAAGALAMPEAAAAELLWALSGPGTYELLVLRAGWSLAAYARHLHHTLVAALVRADAADAPLAAQGGPDGSSRGPGHRPSSARTPRGRVESR